MQLQFSAFVERDLETIAEYIAQDNPLRALTFIREIRSKFSEIEHNPLVYRLRPEIGEEARIATMGNYVILFRATDSTVRIERVVYGGRNLAAVLGT